MKKWLKRLSITLLSLCIIGAFALITFFKTNLFYDLKVLWVETAMSTSNHQFLATWFLSDEEIQNILKNNVVVNDTNTALESVDISETKQEIHVYDISGSTYKGTLITVKDPHSVSLVDMSNEGSGKKLSEIVDETHALIALNASGFSFSKKYSNSDESILNSLTIIDGELLFGDTETRYRMIGVTDNGVLMLGNYTYQEAIDARIVDAIEFGPFLVVNGEAQVTSTSAGGLQPRSAIGQMADGTFIFVVIEGRTTNSLGATYYDLQEIMLEYGAVNAANLDGGGSSSLYYMGAIMNQLSNSKERAIPNAFVVIGDES